MTEDAETSSSEYCDPSWKWAEGPGASRRFRLMADAIPILIAYVDSNHCYRFNNAAYESWFQVERTRLYGRRMEEILGPKVYETVRNHVDAVLAGQPQHFQVELRYQTAGYRFVDVHYFPDTEESGSIAGFYALIYDLTERKAAEEAVRIRDAEIRDLQRLEALGRVVRGLSHDFGNVLTAIISGCKLIEREAEGDDSTTALVQHVLRTAEQGIVLSKQLATMSRTPTLKSRLNVGDTLHRFIILLRHFVGPKIDLRLEVRAGDAPVSMAASELQRIFMNLVINAKDAIGDNEGTIRITTNLISKLLPGEEKASPFLVVSVIDTGCGMSEEIRRRAGDMFFTTKGDRGSGLGLATSKHLIEEAGGYLEIDSAPGQGTTVRFGLPIAN